MRLAYRRFRLLLRGASLIQPELGVSIVQARDHLALLHHVAHVHQSGDNNARFVRRDIRRIVSHEAAGSLYRGGYFAGSGADGGDGRRLDRGFARGRGVGRAGFRTLAST